MIVTQSYLKAEKDFEQPSGQSNFVPMVKQQCICRNGGKPDKDGYIYHNPSCCVNGHGVGGRYLPKFVVFKTGRRAGKSHSSHRGE